MDDAAPNSNSLPTEKKQRGGTGANPNSRKNLIPFTKNDPRINRLGRPKSFNQFRALAQAIASKEITTKDGITMSVGEAILRTWAKSKEPQLQRAFVEYAFGKVPEKLDPLEPFGKKTTLILHYGHERKKRDEDHRSLSAGLSSGAD